MSHTVNSLLESINQQFEQADLYYGHGTDNPWDEAVWLVLHVLNLPLDADDSVLGQAATDEQAEKIQQLANRRVSERKPMAYLLKEAWFYGMPFYVDERVLVPRSPIAEMIHYGFQPWLGKEEPEHVLDLCAGSGCIGIACAIAFPEAKVNLADISEEALQVAKLNIEKHDLEKRVKAYQSDLFGRVPSKLYDLIVSNPPYVDAEDLATMPKEFQQEPELGLAAGHDGLVLVKQILAKANDFLTEDGLLVVEVGNSEEHVHEQFPSVPLTWVDFQAGGHGVFVISAKELAEHRHLFQQ